MNHKIALIGDRYNRTLEITARFDYGDGNMLEVVQGLKNQIFDLLRENGFNFDEIQQVKEQSKDSNEN